MYKYRRLNVSVSDGPVTGRNGGSRLRGTGCELSFRILRALDSDSKM